MEENTEIIVLKGLPKISLNKWYASEHWSKRKKLKDDYYWIIKSQTKKVFPKDKQYIVDYDFHFKNKPLDASNTIALVKLIEDVLFEDDKWDIIKRISISSVKDKSDFVEIKINKL